MVTDYGTPKMDAQLVTKAFGAVIAVISWSGIADTHLEYRSMIVRIYRYPEFEGNGPMTSRLMSLNLSLAGGILMIAGMLCRVTLAFRHNICTRLCPSVNVSFHFRPIETFADSNYFGCMRAHVCWNTNCIKSLVSH